MSVIERRGLPRSSRRAEAPAQAITPPRLAAPAAAAAALTAAALAAAGCAKDIADAYPIEVSVRGNAAPVTVTLEWGVTESEALVLDPDATDAFETQLPPGTPAIVRGPGDCRFTSIDTAIAITTKDEPAALALGCPGLLALESLVPSTPVVQTQENLSYQLTLAALRTNPSPDVMIAPTPRYPTSTVKVNNGSAPQKLRIGINSVDVAAPAYGLTRSYTVTLASSAAAREHSKLAGPDAGGKLGAALAGDGATVAVAQPGVGNGRVLVLRHGSAGWIVEATLQADDVNAGPASGFGAALALLGDTLAVGAPLADTTSSDVGAVYVYRRAGTSWALFKTLTANLPNNRFGSAVALGPGGFLAVGAPAEIRSQGAVYVYAEQGDVPENQRVRLDAPFRDDDDRFGHAVAFASDSRLLVAAPGEDGASTTAPTANDNGVLNSGAVYSFSRATTWTRDAGYFKSTPMPVAGGGFGQTLAASSSWFAASWRGAASGAIECVNVAGASPTRYAISAEAIPALSVDRGRVAFTHPGANGRPELRTYRLEATAVQLAPAIAEPLTGADFGRAVSLAGEHLFVGAPLQGGDAGGFYVFE